MQNTRVFILFFISLNCPLLADIQFSRDIRPILNEHCTKCHGGVKKKGGLSFLNRDDALALSKSKIQAIVPGQAEQSELIKRIISHDEEERMPPEGRALNQDEIQKLKTWINQGAPWPKHWAFEPFAKPELPKVKNTKWVRQPIDAFILNQLESKNITPSPEAEAHTLIKRLHLDLTGLLPQEETVLVFTKDPSEQAYQKLVDKLLASPHFGERWARHWLDQARYADSDGYEKDNARPYAWAWRNWVIDAINRDMPFDQFTTEQIAGDLLHSANQQQRLATAFHRQTLFNREGGIDPEEDRSKRIIDRLSTVSTVWLGLSMSCAQCHDHPYDPIKQKEFYHFLDFFNNADENTLTIVNPNQHKESKRLKTLENEFNQIRKNELPTYLSWKQEQQSALKHKKKIKQPNFVLNLLKKNKLQQNEEQRLKRFYFRQRHPISKKLYRNIMSLDRKINLHCRVISQRKNRRATYLFNRGDFLQKNKEMGILNANVPRSLHPLQAKKDIASRLDLAHWLIDSENPLTRRVVVNKIWSHLMGSAFVQPMDDFGTRAKQPEHIKLLNWLAYHFEELKWSRKQLIRSIVLSSTYRQSSHHRPELTATDPLNLNYYRQNRFRLEAEIIRDISLGSAKLLQLKVGGPSVFPPLPPEITKLAYSNTFSWVVSKGQDKYRRGMYTFFKRTVPDPNLMVFDCPDSNVTATQRGLSNTPLQALTTLNNEVFLEAYQSMAQQLCHGDQLKSPREKLQQLFMRTLSRKPNAFEEQECLKLLDHAMAWYKEHPKQANQLIGPKGLSLNKPIELAAWTKLSRIVMNLDEFFTRE